MTVLNEADGWAAWAQLAPQVGRLRGWLEEVANGYLAVADDDVSDGLGAAISNMRGRLSRLDRGGEHAEAVIKEVPGAVAKWVRLANELGADINEAARDLQSRGWLSKAARFWEEVVIQSANDLGSGVTTVVNDVGAAISDPPSLVKWLVVGAVALAVLKLK